MALLAELARRRLGGDVERVATEALGLVLLDPAASAALAARLRNYFPQLPEPIRFVPERAKERTRPDVVGLHGQREVVHIEGKFWAGFTDAQRDGRYLLRLRDERDRHGSGARLAGALLVVCPPRRLAEVQQRLHEYYNVASLTGEPTWRHGMSGGDAGVAVTDWISICDALEHAGGGSLAEDVRQLRAFVAQVDADAFVPWTHEQLTDRDSPRRHVELVKLVDAIRQAGKDSGQLPQHGRKARADSQHGTGVVIYLGAVWTAFRVDPYLQARYGRSPLWLQWYDRSAEHARAALRGRELFDTWRGCALPVPIPVEALRDEAVASILNFLIDVGAALEQERASRRLEALDEPPPTEDEPEDEL